MSSAHGPSATTTSSASTGPDAVSTRQYALFRCNERASPVSARPPKRGEARGVGARQRQRIVDAHSAGPMDGVTKLAVQRRFERHCAVAVEWHVGDAEARGQFELWRLRGERAVGAIKLEPAAAAEVTLGAGLGRERLVLGDRARQQRPHHFCGLDQPCRLRRGTKSQKPGRDPRQMPEVIIGDRRTLQCDAYELRKARREGGGKHRIAFDNAGVAIGGSLPRPAAVDQRNRQAAFGEVDRNRGADNSGSKHDDVSVRQENLQCGLPLSYAHPQAGRQGPARTINENAIRRATRVARTSMPC